MVRHACEQLALDVSRHFQPRRKTPSNNTTTPREFPSVVSVLQATAISQVLESFGEEEQELVMDILSKDYDWQTAIQSSTQSRERAFLLLDVSAVVKSHFHLQKLMPNVQLQYKVQHNRDPKLLELLGRLKVGLRTNSNLDVQAASAVKGGVVLVDDAGATRKPNGYLRRYSKASSAPLAVDGPEEVARIHHTHERLIQRHHDDTHSLSFTLKLPRDCSKWEPLLQSTQQACAETNTQLVGVSVDVVEEDDYLINLQESLQRIAFEGMHVDVTGTVTQTMAPFLTGLVKSYDQVTVDASALLVAHAGALCTRIIGVKVVGHTRHLYIDDGCYGSLCRDFKNSHQEHVPLPLFKNTAETQMTTVWGPTCDGLDRVCQNVFLPQMHVDNWLVFFDMGQSSGMGTAFNGFDPPDIVHYCVLGYSRQF